ncbi:polyprenol monophosphomannose synthase [Candidatus Nitrosocosmicus franklandus]|uniref:Undecaprenyl-phosphate mannosyltransferase n=1 Tax=Candidatus Nitrosocosmicus franklandianus TaxID=1798806 RepID=A0A484I5D2_9ARCH|nr:polyprenol monophosphomannose synthase [Candidatus Nitrosocosmicus franklandus]VFJ12396.1 Undecaprenyl-phosphate mannosyltransferase [Candidatus Nitrosocosmicus franklandus]
MSENVICRKTQEDLIKKFNSPPLYSIVIPTFNESENILKLIHEIKSSTIKDESYELIIVDDDSPDGTVGLIIKDFTEKSSFEVYKIRENIGIQSHQYYLIYPKQESQFYIKVIKRRERTGLISALYEGFKSSIGQYIIVMDADFSHSPTYISHMINEITSSDMDLVIASRYVQGGQIIGWTAKRMFLSRFATNLSKLIFGLSNVSDPMSGFFIVKRNVIRKMHFSTSGFKILLEILVRSKDLKIKEIPYTFYERALGSSKLNTKVTIDFFKGLYTLYKSNR